jgi:hypothetical protein
MQKMKDQMIRVKLRTRELNLEVLLWKGLKDETLGERGSLWCCYGKASVLSPPSLD